MSARRDKNPPEEWAEKITGNKDKGKTDRERESEPSYTVNDRRHWAEDSGEIEGSEAESAARPPAYIEALEEEIRKKDETLREYISQYKAAKSQMNDAIGRIEREKAREVNFRIAELSRAFLSILDDLSAAVEAVRKTKDTSSLAEGLDLITQRIKTTLDSIGITEIEAIGKSHDPNFHEAVAVEPVDSQDKDGLIIAELKKGFMLGDVLVRPSSVVVGKYEP